MGLKIVQWALLLNQKLPTLKKLAALMLVTFSSNLNYWGFFCLARCPAWGRLWTRTTARRRRSATSGREIVWRSKTASRGWTKAHRSDWNISLGQLRWLVFVFYFDSLRFLWTILMSSAVAFVLTTQPSRVRISSSWWMESKFRSWTDLVLHKFELYQVERKSWVCGSKN